MPWQQELADVAGEFDPITGLLRYDETDATVPRQSGKSTITLAKSVHRLTVMARRLGPQRSTYTAQLRLAARRKLERDFATALRASRTFREVSNAKARPTKATEWRLSLNNGNEHIQFGSGSYLQIDAPSRTGGHGDTLDDGTIDEAFAHETDEIEAAMRPAMATRKNAQMWVISTAGDERSVYLYRKVLAGRSASETGAHGRVCYVEYSAPDDADPADPATWWACMPALGHTINESFIRSEWERAQRKGQEGIDTFRRAYLNQWPKPPILDEDTRRGVFGGLWLGLADPDAPRGNSVSFGVAVAPDRAWSAIAVAWHRPDAAVQVMLSDYHAGTDWITARAKELRNQWGGRFTASTAAKGIVTNAIEPSAAEQALADTGLDDLVLAGRIRHGNQPALNVAVQGAQWVPFGDTRRIDRKGATDIQPLVAAALAVHGLVGSAKRPGRFMSA